MFVRTPREDFAVCRQDDGVPRSARQLLDAHPPERVNVRGGVLVRSVPQAKLPEEALGEEGKYKL
jgi:hypothetical protein